MSKATPNPLPCGCAAFGKGDIEAFGSSDYQLRMTYKDIHVRHCPLHASADALLAAAKAALNDGPHNANHGLHAHVVAQLTAAIAAAEGTDR